LRQSEILCKLCGSCPFEISRLQSRDPAQHSTALYVKTNGKAAFSGSGQKSCVNCVVHVLLRSVDFSLVTPRTAQHSIIRRNKWQSSIQWQRSEILCKLCGSCPFEINRLQSRHPAHSTAQHSIIRKNKWQSSIQWQRSEILCKLCGSCPFEISRLQSRHPRGMHKVWDAHMYSIIRKFKAATVMVNCGSNQKSCVNSVVHVL